MSIEDEINKISDLFFRENEGQVWRHVNDSIEKPLLEKLMRFTEGNQLQAARILGINRNTLRTKLRKHGLLR
jgi:Fis family transcriptional regulator